MRNAIIKSFLCSIVRQTKKVCWNVMEMMRILSPSRIIGASDGAFWDIVRDVPFSREFVCQIILKYSQWFPLNYKIHFWWQLRMHSDKDISNSFRIEGNLIGEFLREHHAYPPPSPPPKVVIIQARLFTCELNGFIGNAFWQKLLTSKQHQENAVTGELPPRFPGKFPPEGS